MTQNDFNTAATLVTLAIFSIACAVYFSAPAVFFMIFFGVITFRAYWGY